MREKVPEVMEEKENKIQKLHEQVNAHYVSSFKEKELWLKQFPEKTFQDWLIEVRAKNENQRHQLRELFKWAQEKKLHIAHEEFETSWEIPATENFRSMWPPRTFGKVHVDFCINGIPYDLDMPEYINESFDKSRPWDTANEYIKWKLNELGFPSDNRIAQFCYENYDWAKYNYLPWTKIIPKESGQCEIIGISDLLQLINEIKNKNIDQLSSIVVWSNMPKFLEKYKYVDIKSDVQGQLLYGQFADNLGKYLYSLASETPKIATSIIYPIGGGSNNLLYYDKNSSEINLMLIYPLNNEVWGKTLKFAHMAERQGKCPSMLFYHYNDKDNVLKKIDFSSYRQYLCVDDDSPLLESQN